MARPGAHSGLSHQRQDLAGILGYDLAVDSGFLLRTVELAQHRRGFCAPNPSVGAVLVCEGQVVSEGFHWAPGHPHAEVEAIRRAPPEVLRRSTLYVSLEPCCHHGRTPPCTGLILESGIPKVVYAFRDPNPKVAGQGHALLESEGVEVRFLALPEAEVFYRGYAWWQRTGLPYTTVKLAMSLDGKTAGPGGKPLPLTSGPANAFTHLCRRQSDALLTTARTVLADNPQLNVRLEGDPIAKPVVILDRLARTPLDARIFQTALSVLVFVAEDAPPGRRENLRERGAEVVELACDGGLLPLKQVLSHLGEKGLHDLWVEGGGALFNAFLREKLAQRALLYVTPDFVGDGINAFESWAGFGDAARVQWLPQGRDVLAEVVW
ncbi:bifunctional diaminohydroxyphosphoribosylaminopyrimidine deaminase/5-amino-6-(5-phosphoribosylamino)uracil reductase RibD [bacterium]|nr:bifunctional diaminohydroxyphosphoribosylaminopyrimidine deaminase/5-amino-6-(5-phosphoribosylamino)uracil reductase RibD [bacterium]